MKQLHLVVTFFLISYSSPAQSTPFFLKGALKENRQQLYRNIVNNTIIKNLSVPLTDTTEDIWQDAFWAMELINYKSPWIDGRIHIAFTDIQDRTTDFQRAILELAYTNYKDIFIDPVRSLLLQTKDAKIFAMCAVYILSSQQQQNESSFLAEKIKEKISGDKDNPILQQLQYQIQNDSKEFITAPVQNLLNKDFLPGNALVISFQRKNRNYPGLVIVRDAAGNFIKENEQLFSLPQLARSISNLPGYLTNGNTPEGIFRMDGFDTSKSSFIGPTTNIQLTMPFENKPSHFFRDSTSTDSSWNIDQYKQLLPAGMRNDYSLFQSWYAGKAGRNEIIAHGTTIDPAYYKNKTYYPLTPTQGCLCTKEIWNDENGRLMASDQQKLVDAVIKAGGPSGYLIVVNIDDQQKPVELNEILYLLQIASH
ncbi:MAG: hypothetical protein QM737_12335 [Ferruginibacter sp.]